MRKPTVCAVALNVTAWSAMNSPKNQSLQRRLQPKKQRLQRRLLRRKPHLRKRRQRRKPHPPKKLQLRKSRMSLLSKLPLRKLFRL
jgi:hypothetical protein